MNKVAKVLILLGLGLMIIATVVTAFNFNSLFSPLYYKDEFSKREYVAPYGINKLVVDVEDDEIRIIPYNGDVIKITYYEKEDAKYSITDNLTGINQVVQVKKQAFRCYFCFNFNFKIPELLIEVPEGIELVYDIKTENGKITVEKILLLDSTFRSENARIEVINIINPDISLNLYTTNSRISLTNVEVNNLRAQTDNARIELNQVQATTVNLNTSNSKINLNNVIADNEIVAKTSNGRIEITNITAPLIDLKTSNASIKGTIVGDNSAYKKQMSTSNGEITINGYEYGTRVNDNHMAENQIFIKTTNASIKIDFR